LGRRSSPEQLPFIGCADGIKNSLSFIESVCGKVSCLPEKARCSRTLGLIRPNKGVRMPNNRNLLALALIVFIDTAGIGLIVPVMPTLIESLTGRGIDRAAEIGGWLLFAYSAMQFIFAPVIGGLSDRFGRKPVLLTTLALLGVDYTLIAWAPTIAWLFAGRIISGIMGAS
jgi:predicted MFS family arabinose efflux permease